MTQLSRWHYMMSHDHYPDKFHAYIDHSNQHHQDYYTVLISNFIVLLSTKYCLYLVLDDIPVFLVIKGY